MKLEDQNAIKIDDYGENIPLSALLPRLCTAKKSFWDIFSNDPSRKAIKVPSSGSLIKIFLLLETKLGKKSFDFSCGNNEHFKVSFSPTPHARHHPTDRNIFCFNLCVKKGATRHFAPSERHREIEGGKNDQKENSAVNIASRKI